MRSAGRKPLMHRCTGEVVSGDLVCGVIHNATARARRVADTWLSTSVYAREDYIAWREYQKCGRSAGATLRSFARHRGWLACQT